MFRSFASLALAAGTVTIPAQALAGDLSDDVDRIATLFSQGFSGDLDGELKELSVFLAAAKLAEHVLEDHADLDDATIRDMHQQAGNGYYYAAEREHEFAKTLDDPAKLTAAKIAHLEKALHHHNILFKNGAVDRLVAEYYFGTYLLLQYGLETGDPNTKRWADAHLAAARLRIIESEQMNLDINRGARQELINALLDFHDATGDTGAKEEALQVFEAIPEDKRRSILKRRLATYFPEQNIE